jgi:general secretion pathway protein D
MRDSLVSLLLAALFAAAPLKAQVGGQAPARPAGAPPEEQAPPPAQPLPGQQARPGGGIPVPQAAPQPGPAPQGGQPPAGAPAQARLTDNGGFMLNNVSLIEMIDILAKQLKINYILDPRVKGTVTVFTYGEVKPVDLMPLMETILRVNGASMVKVGDLYRIVPINLVSQLPVDPTVNLDPKTLPEDERMVLNLIFLKFATATELDKLITPFLGEGASHTVYEPANLIILQDNSRSMKRTMELIALFDSDNFAGQRVRLFDISHSRPSDLVKDLDNVFKAYALSEKNSAVRFIPVDRINTVIAVAPNPGIFAEVDNWIKKLDVAVRITAGAVTNWVYRLKYGRAETVAMAITALYTGNTMALVGLANQAHQGMIASGMGYAGAVGGQGYTGFGGGNMYGAGYANNGYQYGAGAYAPNQGGYSGPFGGAPQGLTGPAPSGPPGAPTPAQDLTGQYLGYGVPALPPGSRIPHVIPNPFDNTLLIQGTPQEYEQIAALLRQLDVPPRQVLIDAKIYEVDLNGELNGGVESCLAQVGSCASLLGNTAIPPSRTLAAIATGASGLGLTTGALVSQSKELLAVVSAFESKGRTRVVSSPSVIATDSVPATMNVGSQIPVATSTVPSGVQSGGNTVFAQTISQQSTGVTLSLTAHVNSSGVVTMIINQQVSAPQPAAVTSQYSSLNSPSFSNRSVSTQVTVEDGDMVALGGAITESYTESSSGIPFLHRIPVFGAVFGAKSYSSQRTELIIFLTPHVIYDTTQIIDATEEIKSNLKHAARMLSRDE